MEENFLRWFSSEQNIILRGEYFPKTDNQHNFSFHSYLYFNKKDVKSSTLDIIEYLNVSDNGIVLGHGINAYHQFQDINNISLDLNDPFENRHYCYYESLVYLRESIVCWIEKNILAGLVLLRPFMELSILHLYWYLRCENSNYDAYYKWLNGEKGKPPFKNQLDYIFNNIPTKKLVDNNKLDFLKDRITKGYRIFSSYNHTPLIDESLLGKGTGQGNISLHTFYLYQYNITFLLREIIYLYILVFPMSLFPIERYRKWAFGGPAGIFFDNENFDILQAFIGENNILKLKDKLRFHEKVINLLDWQESFPALTDEEINSDWNRFKKDKNIGEKAKTLEGKIGAFKAFHRALSWAMNYQQKPESYDDIISDEDMVKLNKLISDW